MARALSVCAKSGDVAGAEEIITKMRESNATIQRNSLNCMLKACSKSADGQAAELWFSRMGHWGLTPNRASYCGVILAWVKSGNFERSEQWIRRLYAAGFTTPKGFCRQLVRKSIRGASTDVIAQHAEQVTPWLGQLHHMGVPIDRSTVNLLMGAFARNGNIIRTEQWAAFMEEAGISPNRSTFCALVTASRRSQDQQRASKWLACMAELGFTPGDLETDRELGQLGDADSDSGDLADSPPGSKPTPAPHARVTATLVAPVQRLPAQRQGARQQLGAAAGKRWPPGTWCSQEPIPVCGAPPGLPGAARLPQRSVPTPCKVQLVDLGSLHSEDKLTPKKVSVPAFLEPRSNPIQSLAAGGLRPLGLGAAYPQVCDADPVRVWSVRL